MAQKIRGFDGIRGIAACAVVLTHVGAFKMAQDWGVLPRWAVVSLYGAAAVQVFFVLSGFLITYLLVAEVEKTGSVSLFNFYVRRSLRIFPLYFLVVGLTAVLWIFGENVANGTAVLYAACYATNFVPRASYVSLLGHTWSLAVEEHFYLVWPFVFLGLSFRRNRLLIVLAMFIVGGTIAGMVIDRVLPLRLGYTVERWSFVAGVNIAFGCVLALLLTGERRSRVLERALSIKPALLLGVLLWFSALWLGRTDRNLVSAARGIGMSLVVAWVYLNQEGLIAKALEVRPLRYLGAVSYGIYMWQGFYLSTGTGRSADQSWPIAVSWGLLLLVVTVPLSFHFFESPVRRLQERFQRPVRAKLAAAGG